MAHTVTVEKPPSFPLHVEAWRNLVRVRRPRVTTRQFSGGMRGTISGMSRASRRRLMVNLGKANADPALFVTLTYGRDYPSLPESKEDLRVVVQRLQRLCAKAGIRVCILWRVERQRRGAAHYHCLVWTPERSRVSLASLLSGRARARARAHLSSIAAKVARKGRVRPQSRLDWLIALSAIWEDRLNANNMGGRAVLLRSVDVRCVLSRSQVVAYVSKYLAKVDRRVEVGSTPSTLENTGRVWGIRGDRRLLDQRSFALLSRERDGSTDSDLMSAWRETGLSWPLRAEEDGVNSYFVFLPADAFWRVFDRLCRVFVDLTPGLGPPIVEFSPD